MGILDGYYGKGGAKTGSSETPADEFDPTKYSRLKPLSYYTPAAPEPTERTNAPGLMSDVRRASGQFVSGVGSTLRDIGAEGVGSEIEQYGAGVVQRNPSEIRSFEDVLSRPFTTAREAVGEVVPQVGLALGSRVVGGLLGLPFGPVGVAAGQFLGGLLPTAAQTYGGIRTEQREKGIDERGRALAVTIPAALLERFGGAERVALRVAGEGTEFLQRAAGTGIAKAAGKQFVRGGVEELVTEIPQTALERFGVSGQAADLTSPEALSEYGVAGAKGFLGGGTVRAGLSTLAGTRKEPTVTVQPDGTITTDQPLAGAEEETDLTAAGKRAPRNVLMTPEQAAQRLQDIQGRRPAPLADTAFEPLPAQRGLFDTRGGVAPPAPVAGEQIDLFGGGGQLPTVDERQGDLFAPTEPTFQTRITAGLLDSLGLPRQSSMYRQLLNKDMADPTQQPQIAELFDRVRADANISERTKAGVEGLAMQAFGGLAQQQAMFGPRGGAYPQGIPSTAQAAPGPIENILPTAPLGVTQPAAPEVAPVEAPVVAQAPAAPAPIAAPSIPVGVDLTPEENRAVKQAKAVFDIAETDADRRNVATIMQRIIDRAAQRSGAPVAEPVTPVGASKAVAAALPAAPVAAGVSSTATTGAPSGTQAPQAKQAETQRAKAPAAPAAAVVEDTAPKNVAEAIKEDNEIDRVLKAIEAEDDKADKLFASVTGDTKKAPGKPSMPAQVYAAIRNAILNPGKAVVVRKAKSVEKDAAATEKYGAKAKRIAEAANEFAAAYETYASQNLVRSGEVIKRGRTADDVVAGRATQLRANAAAVQQALAKLGEAVEGNAKDVEAVVRFVKDRAQKEKKGDVKTVQADITLSRAWTAAKSESFMGEPDLLATTGTEVRQSREATARGATPQLVDAATEGYATFGNGKPQTGLNGILNYIRAEGTPFEKTLAQAIKLAVAGKAPINIKFVKEGTSQYDPKTNTITINETSSKEVALHEALHGALQWFVYTNPNAAQVVALKTALQRVVNYDGKLPPKAAEVQALLKKILAGKSKTAELDAVLELVSYGNTLNDFRRALQAMESDAPRTFTKFANNVMDAIYALVRRMLGSNQTVASDVMENTFQLLEAARAATQETAPSKGNILKAEVQTSQTVQLGTSVPESNNAIIAGPSNILPSNEQLAKYSKTLFPRFALTEVLFNKMGWADWMSGIDKKAVTPLSNFIQKELPALARGVSWVNSHYSMPTDTKAVTSKLLNDMKDNRRGGSALFERAAGFIKNLPVEQSRAYLDYMNARFDFMRGTGKEPSFKGTDTLSKAIADQVVENAFKYMTQGAMDQKSRDVILGKKVGSTYVGGIKFTENFVFPESVDKLASNTFGARNLRALKSSRTKDDVTLDAIRTRVTVDGDQIIEDKFVGIYNPTPELKARLAAGESIADVMPDEFISAELLAESTPLDDRGQAMLVDPSFVWDLQTKGKNGYRLTAHYDAAQAFKAKTTGDIANAFQNTMTLLANAYSTYQFADGLDKIGATSVDKNGKVTARDGSAVVYDSLAQLNEALNSEGVGAEFKPNKDRSTWTRQVDKDSIINISANEARADAVQSLFRNRGQYVRVPANEQVYGALAGKIVNGSVWAAIQDASDRRPSINVPYAQDVMQFHKAAKTVYNPATWGTNVATNFGFAVADDIPMATIAHAGRLYAAATMPAEARKKLGLTLTPQEERLMVKIINSNALLGTFSSTEIKAEIYQAMKSNLDGPERNIGSRLLQLAGMEKSRVQAIEKYAGTGVDKAKRFNEGMQEWYAAQDNIFRVASVLNYVGKAASQGQQVNEDLINDAGRHAREAFLDYDIDSKAIRIARQTAFPFISWPYAATKLVGRLAIHKPWKLVNLYAAYAILDGMMSAMAGDDEDELRKSMPEYMRERLLFGFGPNAYVRIPFMGDSENPMYYHLGKYMFPSSLIDSSPQGFAGVDWWPSALTPTGPFIGTILSLVGGIDPFTGDKLTPESATNLEAFAGRMKYVQAQFVPNLPFINSKETDKLVDAVSGRTDKTPNHASLTMARYLGLRMYDFNVDSQLEAQDRAAAAIEKDYKMEISKIRRQQERLEKPDWDTFYEREEEILKRLEKRLAKLRGEEPPEE